MRTILDFTLIQHESFFTKKKEISSIAEKISSNKSFIINEQFWLSSYLKEFASKESYKIVDINYSSCISDKDILNKLLKTIYLECIQSESITKSLIKFAKYFNNINLKFESKDNPSSFYFEFTSRSINTLLSEILDFLKQKNSFYIFLHTNIGKIHASPIFKKIINEFESLQKNIFISNYLHREHDSEEKISISNFTNLETIILSKNFLKQKKSTDIPDLNEIIIFCDYKIPLIEQILNSDLTLIEYKKFVKNQLEIDFMHAYNKFTSNQQKALFILLELAGQNIFNNLTIAKYEIQKSSLERSVESLLESNTIIKTKNGYKFTNPLFKYWLTTIL